MAVTINHPFVSAKGDGSDATLVRPSNWNASHNLNMATARLLGRLTAGPGLVEEIPVTAYMAGLLNTADIAALAVALGLPTTGDAKLTFKTVADVGWILANDGTIGDATSGATVANATTTTALFTHFYNTFSDAVCPVQTSTGAATTRGAQGPAATAFSSHCRMMIPKTLGRAIIIAGTGAGLSARALAGWSGEESHQLTAAESVDHVHAQTGSFVGSGSGTISGSGGGTYSGNTATSGGVDHLHTLGGTTGTMNSNTSHSHTSNAPIRTIFTGSGADGPFSFPQAGTVATIDATNTDHTHNLPGTTGAADRSLNHTHTCSGSVTVSSITGSCSVNVNTSISGNTGGAAGFTSAAHNNMQPWTAWNVMIRL